MTTCYLTILKVLNEAQINELANLLEAMQPTDPNVAEAVANNDQVTFISVFEGDLPTPVLHWFNKNKVSFVWEWEAYGSVGAGQNFFDAERDEMCVMRLHENIVVVPLNQASNPDVVPYLIEKTARLKTLRAAIGIT